MFSIRRFPANAIRKIVKYLPVPGIVINKLLTIYLGSVYASNRKLALKAGLFGDRRTRDFEYSIKKTNIKKISDLLINNVDMESDVSICPPELALSKTDLKAPEIKIYNAFSEYIGAADQLNAIRSIRGRFETSLLGPDEAAFEVTGYCSSCQDIRKFVVDYNYAYERTSEGRLMPNWRESLECEKCKMKNRVRAAVDLLYNQLAVYNDDRIYVTEQLTSFYTWLKYHYVNAVGSEYLGVNKVCGKYYGQLRHEDITQLSFNNNSLDIVLTFDVLEHVPDTEKSLAEFIRCLKPGGFMIISAPFVLNQYETIVRAKIGENGKTQYLHEPEYHGNPTSPVSGSLCYYHFGWQLLDQLRSAGAADAAVVSYYSSERMNIGKEQVFIIALKKI